MKQGEIEGSRSRQTSKPIVVHWSSSNFRPWEFSSPNNEQKPSTLLNDAVKPKNSIQIWNVCVHQTHAGFSRKYHHDLDLLWKPLLLTTGKIDKLTKCMMYSFCEPKISWKSLKCRIKTATFTVEINFKHSANLRRNWKTPGVRSRCFSLKKLSYNENRVDKVERNHRYV